MKHASFDEAGDTVVTVGRGVLVVGELDGGGLSRTTSELLAAGKKLYHCTGGELAVALVGHGLSGPAAQAIQVGGERVYTADDPLLESLPTELCLEALDSIYRAAMPEVILFARTTWGRELATRLASRLGRWTVAGLPGGTSRPAERVSHGRPACVWRQFPGAGEVHHLAPNSGSTLAGV